MSTVVSETITTMEDIRMREKPISKLVRTSSLERIRELNSYICSHHYYFVPALLNWLKTSQHGLESNLDVAAAFYRHFLYNILLCKVIEFKLVCKGCFSHSTRIFNTHILNFLYNTCSKIKDSAFMFKLAVYVVVAVVSLEISSCFYLLLAKNAPVGLLFLSGCCMWSVVFLFYEGTFYFEQQKREWNLKFKSKTN